jgi:hypothetical protein
MTGGGRLSPVAVLFPVSTCTCPSRAATIGHPKNLSIGKLFELPLVSRNAIYDCAQDFNVLDLARVDRMQVFG